MKTKNVTRIALAIFITALVFNNTALAQNWTLNGNFNANAASKLGTMSNFPLNIFTSGYQQMVINPNGTKQINGVNQNVSGYIGIGPGIQTNNYFSNHPAATLLHLYGTNNTNFAGISDGWRKWMKSGILINENSDAVYFGLKPELGQAGNITNRSDAVICWSDDVGSGGNTADKLRFIFTASNFTGTNGNGDGNSPIHGKSLNGYEFMRMSSSPNQTNSAGYPVGNIGIGPVFTDTKPAQNRLHVNAEDNLAVYVQISNQNGGSGTGQTANDGLQIGYPTTATNNKPVYINQKENDRIVFFTNSGSNNSNIGERMSITHIGALNNGVAFNPAGLGNGLTRISISHNATTPVTRPLSLLHLGYNTSASNDGWRDWMDIGTFTSYGSDNMYIGLKQKGHGELRQEAVINWGDNETGGGTGPGNLHFIFTSKKTGTDNAHGPDGLEGMRMTPNLTNGVYTGIGGDPILNLYGPAGNSPDPTQTLEVNSWGTNNC